MAMIPADSTLQQRAPNSSSPLNESVSSLRTVQMASSLTEGGVTRDSTNVIAGYSIQGRLGIGSFASVFKGVRVADKVETPETNQRKRDIVAIKAITRSEKLSKKILANLEIEISV